MSFDWSIRLPAYARLIRLSRPIGAILLGWPALWAVWLASSGKPLWSDVVIVLIGAWLTRSAGCAINDWADSAIDRQVSRTQQRPLASHTISHPEAIAVAVVLLLPAAVLSFFLSHSVWMFLPPTLLLIVCYPFCKRFFILPQLVLAITFATAVPIAWYAVAGEFNHHCWLLTVLTVIWVFNYDTIYALSDVDDDRRLGIHSSVLFFGSNARKAIGLFHSLLMLGLWLFGLQLAFGWWWWIAWLFLLCSVLYQHRLLARGDYDRAFRHNGWFGLVVWLGLMAEFYLPAV